MSYGRIEIGFRGNRPGSSPIKVKLSAFLSNARLLLDGAVVATNPMEMSFKKDGSKHWLRAEAVGFETRSEEFAFDGDRAIHLALDPVAAGPVDSAKAAVTVDKPATPHAAGGTRRVADDKVATAATPEPPVTAAPTTHPVAPVPADKSKKRQLDDDNPFEKK